MRLFRLPAFPARAKKGDCRKCNACDDIPAREGKAEHPQGRVVAGGCLDGVQITQEIAGVGGDGRRPGGAGNRPCPETPFHAGVIDAEPGADQHRHADKGKKHPGDLNRQFEDAGCNGQYAQRNGVIIGIALQQAQRAGRITANMLETEGGADGEDHSRRDAESGERAAIVGGGRIGHVVFLKLREEADIPDGLSKRRA